MSDGTVKTGGRRQGFGLTPFQRQCFVTLGVSLNMAGHGLVMGFTAILLPQLRRADSLVPIDAAAGSWIASILGFALVTGNFAVPSVMSRHGRRAANLVSISVQLVGWVCVITAGSVPALLVARFLQGFGMGMSASLGPVLIGEYTSPKNRGAFLTTVSLAIAAGVLTVHTTGSFCTWQVTALVLLFIVFLDLLIVIHSPESPSWLSDQGRYEECRRVFRWLRGDGEEQELESMIEASVVAREAKEDIDTDVSCGSKMRRNLAYFRETIRRKEFYKPIFIMIHIYTMGQWAGANILAAYAMDVFGEVIGDGVNVAIMVITMDVQRIISNTCAVYFIKKIRRRTMLFITGGINLAAFLLTAGYSYGKTHGLLPFDHPLIGAALIHVHMLSIATGMVPLPFIIAGEVFPLEYRSLAGGISVLFLSSNLFINVKTVPFLFASIGIHGAYCIYALVVAYCLTVAGVLLPETKDRTLQQIEDEFRGRPLTADELKSTYSLTSAANYTRDRRCSSIVL